MQILKDIEAIVGTKGILTGDDVANRKAGIWIDEGIKAKAIVRPKNTEELSKVLKICNENKQSVVPHGGLTGLAEGAITEEDQIAISTERLNTIEGIDTVGRTITLGAGVPLEKAQNEAEKNNLMLANAGGNMVVKYGMTRDSVLGLEAVLADGRIVTSLNEMLKNNSGYDLKQLFIGTEGTLGFVTRAVLRLREKPKSTNTALLAVNSFDQVTQLLKHIDRGLGGNLSAFEVMWEDFYKQVTTEPALNSPPLTQGFPYYVLVETTGSNQAKDTEHFEELLEEALNLEIIEDAVISKSDSDRSSLWAIRDDVEQHYQDGPVKMFDVSMPILSMEQYIKDVHKKFSENWSTYKCVVFGHLADGNLHVVSGVGSDDKESIKKMESCIYDPLRSIGGAVSAEHGIGLEKKDYLGISRTEIEIDIMRTLKQTLDPNNILNPGKVFD
jgi:FAD/FMN-containing dehydrogenase